MILLKPPTFESCTTHGLDGLTNQIRFHIDILLERGCTVRLLSASSSHGSRANYEWLDCPWMAEIYGDRRLHGSKTAIAVRNLDELLCDADIVVTYDCFFVIAQAPLMDALLQIARRRASQIHIHWIFEIDKPTDSMLGYGDTWRDAVDTSLAHLRSLPENVKLIFISAERRREIVEMTGLSDSISGSVVCSPAHGLADLGCASRNLIRTLERQGAFSVDVLLFLPARHLHDISVPATERVLNCVRARGLSVALMTTLVETDERSSVTLARWRERSDVLLLSYLTGEDTTPAPLHESIIRDLYNLADGVLFLSEREGYGLPIAEAAYFKCPVLAMSSKITEEVSGGRCFTTTLGEIESDSDTFVDHLMQDNTVSAHRRARVELGGSRDFRTLLEALGI